MEDLLTELPDLLLEGSLLLGGAVLVGLLAQRIHIPLSVVLAVAGILVAEIGGGDLALVQLVRG